MKSRASGKATARSHELPSVCLLKLGTWANSTGIPRGTFAEDGMADWLISKVGFVGALLGCGLIFSALLWIASRLDD
jgi:hypothetical protein